MQIKLVAIGHCCHDLLPEGSFVPGGSAMYVSLACNSLGANATIISSLGQDYLFHNLLSDNNIKLIDQKSKFTTVFENRYTGSSRQQYLLAKAANIQDNFVETNLPEADIILLCPICDEISFNLKSLFPSQLVAATIQGWLRQVDTVGKVSPKLIDWSQLQGIDIIILSKEDIATIPDSINEIVRYVPIVVLTDGPLGATIFEQGVKTFIPVYQVNERDATGAGDVFAVAFLLNYFQSKDVVEACRFAHAAASFIVEGNHISNLPSLEKIYARISKEI